MAEALIKKLHSLTIKCDSYDGSENVQPQQFIDRFNRYLETTGKISPDTIKIGGQIVPNPRAGVLEKEYLRLHLESDALSFFKNLNPELSYKECCEQLVARFELTDQQKHARKLQVFKMRQRSGETYSAYVSRVCDAASILEIQDRELVTILTLGADPSIRNFLMMEEPQNLIQLMALPLAREDRRTPNEQFVGAVDVGASAGDAPNETYVSEDDAKEEYGSGDDVYDNEDDRRYAEEEYDNEDDEYDNESDQHFCVHCGQKAQHPNPHQSDY